MANMYGFGRMLLTIIACGVFLFFYARYLEWKNLYYPMRQLEATPADIRLEYRDVFFYTEDNIKLHGWFIPYPDARVSVIFSHGNGGNISHRLEKIFFFYNLGVNLFIFDYRGYGRSKGRPSEKGLYMDMTAAYNYLIKNGLKIKEKQFIIAYGESLGGAVAIELASKVDIDGLIVEGAFTNVADMARIIYPFLPAVFLKSKFDSLSKVPNIKTPKLFMHGAHDEIVPLRLGKKLFEAAAQPKEFLLLDNGHNEGFFTSEQKIKKAIEKFLKKFN